MKFDIPVIRLEFGDKHWVDISEYETEGDFQSQLSAVSVDDIRGENAKDGNVGVAIGQQRIAVLKSRIKAWSFSNAKKFSEEDIVKLPRFITQAVMDKIDELDKEQADPEIQKKFLT